MFDIGFSKIILIFALALVVLGPQKLPGVVQTIGRWVGRARVMARQFRDQLEQESEGFRKTSESLREAADGFKRDFDPNAPLATPKAASPVPMTGAPVTPADPSGASAHPDKPPEPSSPHEPGT